ncbi:hypothetical protein CANCADRAFT_3965 [Tortispora caseinolytica NRRL Y-17796]|uniref:HTH cro/C1-type domain-containing protein n=1 Tax=Tortispora caseinolytica NRRL Y-17796 TaxID=767744 RepID=A0A1E4TC88_9ASCO|nr:hypothetical protein CANCADRAFT_3965 [Tortispora caseinolytica NRRL Y-17796]
MSSDWDTVTVIGQRANANRITTARTNAEVNAARRAGAIVSVDKKFTGGTNKGSNMEGQRLAKLDRENEVAPPPKLDMSVGKVISRARQEKKFTQKDLATRINEKQTVVNDYEAGRAVPNQQVLMKMERALGVKLRGKDIGEPLGPKKKK